MRSPRYFLFESFRLDVLDERLWQYAKNVRLGQKALAILHRLVTQPGQLVTKENLFAAAWAGVAVSDASLATAIREVRRALSDRARVPHFIETVHGRGYRFIAPVTGTDAVTPQAELKSGPKGPEVSRAFPLSNVTSVWRLVGRQTELEQLHRWHAAAQQGTRRIGFVSGEAGIGKTALVEAFLSDAVRDGARVVRGQCIEHYGAGEAYLPVLEALGRLGRDASLPIADMLRQYAPSWLVHLPSLLSGQQFATSVPVSAEKMLRELAEVLEILTTESTLILVLEDLQWSDTATVEMLAYIARRRDPARLLVIGTYRPVDVLLYKKPLRTVITELRAHPQYVELVLDYLSTESLEQYLLHRCGPQPGLNEFAKGLRRRTGGLPLFFIAIVDELMRPALPDGGAMLNVPHTIAAVIPASVRQLIEHRFEQLSVTDQTILEAASVAGEPFSVAAIGAVTSVEEESIGARCAGWAREGQFLLGDRAVPGHDGTIVARYRFRHGLIPEVVYACIAPERRAHLHHRMGRYLESAYRNQAPTIAAELAMHFEQGQELGKAVSYLKHAAWNAVQRSAYSEALRHTTRAQEILDSIPKRGRASLRQELELLLLRGHVLKTTEGWAVEEVEQVYARGRELSKKLPDTPLLLQALWGLIGVTFVRSELGKTQKLAQELLASARKRSDPVHLVASHMELAGIAFMRGKFASARKHFRQADTFYKPTQHRSHVAAFGADLGLFSRIWATHLTWHEGYMDRAYAGAEETLGIARGLSHPFTQVIILAYATMLHQFRRDIDGLEQLAEATITLSSEHGFLYYLGWAEVLRGWSRATKGAHEEGIADIRRGIQTLQKTAGVRLPYYRGLLAEVCRCHGLLDEALQSLTDAFAEVRESEEHWCEADLHRLNGELFLSQGMNRGTDAEGCFRRAIGIARHQRAKALELRAVVSLGRLWRDQGRRTKARRLVAEVYEWFTEGFETADLRDAKELLHELSSQ